MMVRKSVCMLLAGAVFFCAGCVYEAPLTEEHAIEVDASVLGLWEYVPGENEQTNGPEQMLVLRYSRTEYLIHYPTGKGGMYFRGYPVLIGDVACVQLQLVGSEDGPVDAGEKKLYHVAAYRSDGKDLVVRTLNTELIDYDLQDSPSLRAAFLRNQGSGELFVDPGRFRKVAAKE